MATNITIKNVTRTPLRLNKTNIPRDGSPVLVDISDTRTLRDMYRHVGRWVIVQDATDSAGGLGFTNPATADLDMDNNKITNVVDPTNPQDAATMAYADTKQSALGYTPENTAYKGIALGYASLDVGGKIPVSQLPNSIMEYQGVWDATLNAPTLADGVGNIGDVYRVNVAGTQDLGSGNITFGVGDYAIYNTSDVWEKATTTDAVSSVNSYTGDVTLTKSDIGLSNVTNDAQLKSADLDTDGTLAANSATKIPSQSAVKTYADTKQTALGFTPENVSNKDVDGTLAANSDTKYPSQKAVKTYADTKATDSLVVHLSGAETITDKKTIQGSTTTTVNLAVKTTGDTVDRYQVRSDGRILWGSGTGAVDTFLYRESAARLKTDGTINVNAPGSVSQFNCDLTLAGSNQLTVGGPLQANGNIQSQMNVKTTGYTMGNFDHTIVANSPSSPITISLEGAPANGTLMNVKDGGGNASVNNVTVSGNGHNIDGSASYIINTNYGGAQFQYSSSAGQWFILSKY